MNSLTLVSENIVIEPQLVFASRLGGTAHTDTQIWMAPLHTYHLRTRAAIDCKASRFVCHTFHLLNLINTNLYSSQSFKHFLFYDLSFDASVL